MQFISPLSKFDSDLWYFHIKVPTEIVAYYKDQEVTRFVCKLNDSISIHAAFMPEGDGKYFININKEVRKKLGLELGDRVKVNISADTSKYGIYTSPEFIEVLNSDPDGEVLFHRLTPGKQRSLIYLASKPKSSDKRIEKSIIILNHLVANKGNLDNKMLNKAFKDGLI